MKRLVYTLLSVACICCACAQGARYTPEEEALRKDIGEMLIVGFRGTELTDTNHIVRDIKDYGIGGVILFEYDGPSHSRPRNISSFEQQRRLCSQLQELSDETLFISIDQEGGLVNRLKQSYGYPYFASAASTAQSADSVRHYARLTAETLHTLGINLNFAPCVDVNVNPNCPVIGRLDRSFSSSPAKVSECAQIWIEEQAKQHVLSCLKHFPGHGSSKADTHKGLADVTDTWKELELDPYRTLIANNLGEDMPFMVMTTHVFNAQLDSQYPATLSPYTLTTLLRDSLHYTGLIITDDLAMGAMVQEYEYGEILERTLNAGADILCLSNNGKDYNADIVPQTVDLIFQLVKDGKVSADRIKASAQRIREQKKRL